MKRKDETDSTDEIEITPEMVEAGLDEAWGLDPADGEELLREGVMAVYLAMEKARRKLSRQAS